MLRQILISILIGFILSLFVVLIYTIYVYQIYANTTERYKTLIQRRLYKDISAQKNGIYSGKKIVIAIKKCEFSGDNIIFEYHVYDKDSAELIGSGGDIWKKSDLTQ